MKAVKIKENVFWVGAIDWNLRNFHGYTTERGVTYNAYLVLDEKVTLIDCVKEGFGSELLARISSIIDPSKIDYIISNHVEMDHSGALPKILSYCPNATIVTSNPSGLKGLLCHYGNQKYLAVKGGDEISIGSRTLKFVPTPMLHWPDNMVTYCKEEKILFSNDAFGQHFASTQRFDDDGVFDTAIYEAKKYFANILMPYGKLIEGVLKIAEGLEIDIVAPSHGIIWRSNISDIFAAYRLWGKNIPQKQALIVYDSMWGSTQKMAVAIVEAFASRGIVARMFDLKDSHISNIVPHILDSEYIGVGSPTLNNGMMPTVAAFLCYMKGLSPKCRKAFAFGSYGWSGQSVGLIEDELKSCGFEICAEKIRHQFLPDSNVFAEIAQKVKQL